MSPNFLHSSISFGLRDVVLVSCCFSQMAKEPIAIAGTPIHAHWLMLLLVPLLLLVRCGEQ
jgi:hypothetical protein